MSEKHFNLKLLSSKVKIGLFVTIIKPYSNIWPPALGKEKKNCECPKTMCL